MYYYNNYSYKKEEKFSIHFEDNGRIRHRIYLNKDKYQSDLKMLKSNGTKILKYGKLYPFSSEKNQHNFVLISNICFNTMCDMENGTIPMDEAEYDRLEILRAKADKFFELELPVAWMFWDDLCEAKELANQAILHRQEVCIRNGRPDLVTYCV